jgi:hypothetical protein
MRNSQIDTSSNTVTKRKTSGRRTRSRRQHWHAFGIFLFAMVATGCLVATNDVWSPLLPRMSSDNSTSAVDAREARMGTIVIQNDNDQCEQMKFDNETGKAADYLTPCPKQIVDANGRPVPQGTVHRLDAISKSFFGR